MTPPPHDSYGWCARSTQGHLALCAEGMPFVPALKESRSKLEHSLLSPAAPCCLSSFILFRNQNNDPSFPSSKAGQQASKKTAMATIVIVKTTTILISLSIYRYFIILNIYYLLFHQTCQVKCQGQFKFVHYKPITRLRSGIFLYTPKKKQNFGFYL